MSIVSADMNYDVLSDIIIAYVSKLPNGFSSSLTSIDILFNHGNGEFVVKNIILFASPFFCPMCS